jgi:hypothetical protein
MPTFVTTPRFRRAHAKLSREQRERFRTVVRTQFVPDLAAGCFRHSLRIRRLYAVRGLYEVTWAPDGRATWEFGDPVRPGEPHVIWHQVGTHAIFGERVIQVATLDKTSTLTGSYRRRERPELPDPSQSRNPR